MEAYRSPFACRTHQVLPRRTRRAYGRGSGRHGSLVLRGKRHRGHQVVRAHLLCVLSDSSGVRLCLFRPTRKEKQITKTMKFIRQILYVLLLVIPALPASAQEEGEKKGVDLQEVLWGHIKDAYHWHIMDIGGEPVVIHLPVIVKSSTGWHVFSSSQFAEEPDADGNKPGPFGLYISGGEAHPNKICEMVDGQEVRPFDISITKTVMVLFIDAIILLLCVLIPARWCRKHKIDDPAPKGFTGFMHMFIMYVYNDIIASILGKEAPKYAPYLLTCFFFIFVANVMGVMPFPPGGGNLTGNIACTLFLALCTFIITNVTGTKEKVYGLRNKKNKLSSE